jgi:hypothetical protein
MRIGPTNKFPAGKLSEHDAGELVMGIAVSHKHQVVVMKFGVPVKELGFSKQQAIELANGILSKAVELD